jgi:coenzyme F420-reducing hydrogenase beta subunit
MQWGAGCEDEAVHELRQYKDIKNPDPNKTYHIGFNCEKHVPKKNAHQFIIEEIK